MAKQNPKCSIVALDKFIQATRDSGYKSTVNAVAELVDNSIQAEADSVVIDITRQIDCGDHPMTLAVTDNGCGMDGRILRQALRFGGSTRFNDRSGLGRYGMGLPNASLSQARRVDVYTWRDHKPPIYSYLDVDEIIEGEMDEVPPARRATRRQMDGDLAGKSGTVVRWGRCDRLDHSRVSTIARKLQLFLGRMFRYHIWSGVRIEINGEQVQAVDPLYLSDSSRLQGGQLFQQPIEFDIKASLSNGRSRETGRVVVRFSELPVHEWHGLKREEKRRLGVSNGAGVSVVRGGREIDYGWFFMGNKRRENYDDWWRCEVKFEPVLDEAFGITHTKQQIRPQEYLLDILNPELEIIAKALNARVRRHHAQLKARTNTVKAEDRASARDQHLKPLPKTSRSRQTKNNIEKALAHHPGLGNKCEPSGDVEYRIVDHDLPDTCFFRPLIEDGRVIVLLNRQHEFFKRWYGPLSEDESPSGRHAAELIQLILFAAARAEGGITRKAERDAIEVFRNSWSDALNVFLRK